MKSKKEKTMKAKIIGMVVGQLLALLSPDLLKDAVDQFLDFIEDRVLGSASPIDDAIVIPICTMIREAFDIPDDD
jgi:hypothetical protein